MDNLNTRVVTGAVLLTVIIGSVLLSKFALVILFLIINLLGLFEFYRLFNSSHIYSEKLSGFIFSSTLFITSALYILKIAGPSLLIINIPVAMSLFISELYLKNENPFFNLGLAFLGVFYITVPLILLICIPFFPFKDAGYNPDFLLKYFSLIWIYDSAAFGAGKLFGRKALFKRISPHKTWEGFIGGTVLTLFAAYLISLMNSGDYRINWMIVAAIIIIFGTFGDFIKSMLKRSRHVKDSGRILPGHGGILDRFDSMIGSAPIVFFYLVILVK